MISKFNEDKRLEELFGEWLDSYVYPVLQLGGLSSKIQRNFDATLQKQGVDVIVQANGKKFFIDEKATLHYINKNIPTFAFELLNRKSGAQGWLYNQSYLTTHYLLAWPSSATPNNITNKDDFSGADIMLIERETLVSFLEANGLSETVLRGEIHSFSPSVSRDNFKFPLVSGINLFFTEWLAEKPVNIVIRKELLDSIAVFHKLF